MQRVLYRIVPILALIVIVIAAGCTSSAPPPQATAAQTTAPAAAATAAATQAVQKGTFTLSVGSVPNGGTLPAAYTCAASMPESPPVSWANVPEGTKSLTLIVEDPDALKGTYTHWIVYNIPPTRTSLPGGITAVKEIAGGGQQGDNSAGDHMYAAACPPIGPAHRYVFTLYAVDYTMGLPTADRDTIDMMLSGHWIDKATFKTTYQR
jgi:Raf kinase inhibitor-like YbhB/YbcL family protein